MNECVVCGKRGEKHHIVFKSQGGFDFPLNYIYLCAEHHRGKDGPHKNKLIDIKYKLDLQNKLFNILNLEFYTQDELRKKLKLNSGQLKILLKNIKKYKYGYNTQEIVKKLMGGKFYYEFMLDKYYDDCWNILDEEIFLKKL